MIFYVEKNYSVERELPICTYLEIGTANIGSLNWFGSHTEFSSWSFMVVFYVHDLITLILLKFIKAEVKMMA